MQPLGRKPSRFPGKTDAHPGKGRMNWWEGDMGIGEKKTAARFDAKQSIRSEAADVMNLRRIGDTPPV